MFQVLEGRTLLSTAIYAADAPMANPGDPVVLVIPQFDAGLGTLTGVSVQTRMTFRNAVDALDTWVYPSGTLFNAFTNTGNLDGPGVNATAETGGEVTFYLTAEPQDYHWAVTTSNVDTFTPDPAAYAGSGLVEFTLDTGASFQSWYEGGGNADLNVWWSTLHGANVTVTYTYDEPVQFSQTEIVEAQQAVAPAVVVHGKKLGLFKQDNPVFD